MGEKCWIETVNKTIKENEQRIEKKERRERRWMIQHTNLWIPG